MKSYLYGGRWMRADALAALLKDVVDRYSDADVRLSHNGELRIETTEGDALGYIDLGDEKLVWYEGDENGD